MALKGLPDNYKTFATVVTQRETQALRNFVETEKSCRRTPESGRGENVMFAKQQSRFQGNCYKCGRKGHKSTECYSKEANKWCSTCRNTSHSTRDCRRKQGDAVKKSADQPAVEEHEFIFTISDQANRNGKRNHLLLDSGATSHIIVDREKFTSFERNFDSSNHTIPTVARQM